MGKITAAVIFNSSGKSKSDCYMKNKAIFLDRDGVITKMHYNREFGIIDTPLVVKEIEFVPGIFDFLHLAKQLGYLLVLISNQPGVGIRKISLKGYNQMKDYLTQKLKEQGIALDGQYYCMHHPYASILKYKKDCDDRKPKTGFLVKASKDLDIDLKKSWMIGDGIYDIIAGYNVGCKTILVGNIIEAEYLHTLEEKLGDIKPTFLVKNLMEIKNFIRF